MGTWRFALLFASGCNRVFGLDPTAATPEQDAAIPATPAECAQRFAGSTARQLEPAVAGIYYVTGDENGLAVAEIGNQPYYAVGGGPMMPADNVGLGGSGLWLAPDDAFLYVVAGGGQFYRYELAANTWTSRGPALFDGNQGMPSQTLSTPSTGRRRIILSDGASFHEYRDGATDNWTLRRSYTTANLDVFEMFDPSLTSDGRFLVFRGRRGSGDRMVVFAAGRATDDEDFGLAQVLFVPDLSVRTPFMTRNCRDLYYSTATMGVLRVNGVDE